MCDTLHISLHNTATAQCTFTSRTTNIWNSLDKVTKEIPKDIKAALKKWLQSLN